MAYPHKALIDYLPWTVKDVTEFITIMDANESVFSLMEQEFDTWMDNRFIQTANIDMIAQWEELYNIQPDPANETLEFRRERLLGRVSLSLPYTTFYLRDRLDALLGVGRYYLSIDYDEYTINLDITLDNEQRYNETLILLNLIKPANMVLNLDFIRNTHQDLSKFTHGYLSQYTHTQLRLEESLRS